MYPLQGNHIWFVPCPHFADKACKGRMSCSAESKKPSPSSLEPQPLWFLPLYFLVKRAKVQNLSYVGNVNTCNVDQIRPLRRFALPIYISYPAMYIWQLRNATRRLANRQATVSLTLLRTKSNYDLRNYDETRHGF